MASGRQPMLASHPAPRSLTAHAPLRKAQNVSYV
jgi:hypothetical protein